MIGAMSFPGFSLSRADRDDKAFSCWKIHHTKNYHQIETVTPIIFQQATNLKYLELTYILILYNKCHSAHRVHHIMGNL